MNIFGRKSAGRAAARPVFSRVSSRSQWGGDPWAQGYEAQVRGGYLGNAIAQRAVRLVAQGMEEAEWEVSHPALLAMAMAPSGGGQGLLATVAAHLLLHGNAYVQLLTDGAGELRELFALRPERVSVEADAGGWPVAYLYAVGGRTMRLPVGDPARPAVVHIKAYHPLDDHYGLGCLGAAAGAIAVHNAAARWNTALLDNAARPSGALVYEPADGTALSAEQFDRLRSEMEAGFSGAANAGRPMLLEGGLRWQALSMTPADMDFAGMRDGAAREIALAFGVPPMLLGLPGDATYANYKEASRALWRLTILPLSGIVGTTLAHGVRPWFPDARMRIDPNKLGVLAEDRERMWRQVSAADFLSREEKRGLLGLDGR